MARPIRIDPEGGIHHVFTRGTNRWILFHDDVDRLRFIGTLDRVCDRYNVQVLSYCLMPNHVHLLVRCPDGRLSDAIRDLKSLYAQWFSARHNTSGPIYEGRFGSVLITSDRQLRRVVRYIHRNPYALSPTLELASYRWSSHPIYLGLRPAPAWLVVDIAKPLFGDYRADVERPDDADAVQNTPKFARLDSVEVPGTSTLSARPGLSDILIEVANAAAVPVGDVHPSKRNGLVGIAVLLAADAGYTMSESFEPLGYRTAKAADMAARRATSRLAEDAQLRAIRADASARLWHRAA